jgi:hypothetical protein
MRRLALLYRKTSDPGLSTEERLEAKYAMAEYLANNPVRMYFNDSLWFGLQRYGLAASGDGRLTREERERLMAGERKLKDDQEERWRSYLLLREVVRDAADVDRRRRAAKLALQCLRGISERFGREEEIRKADIELSNGLRASSSRR